jgi:hypothetical protein
MNDFDYDKGYFCNWDCEMGYHGVSWFIIIKIISFIAAIVKYGFAISMSYLVGVVMATSLTNALLVIIIMLLLIMMFGGKKCSAY